MAPTRPLNAAVKAEVAASLNGLSYDRIEAHDDEAYVFIATGLPDFEMWFVALGGDITREPADQHLALWVLRTDTDHGSGAPVRVFALVPDTDQLDPDLADAIRPHAA